MGKSSGSKTSSQLDPTQKAILKDLWGRATDVADQPYNPYGGQTLALPNETQQNALSMAVNGATSNIGGGLLDSAASAVGGAASYSPMMVNGGYNPMMIGQFNPVNAPSAQAAAGYNPMMIDSGNFNPMQVNAGAAIDQVGRYMNPYTSNVIDATMADMDRARQITLNSNAASADAAGAFGGSRHGIVDSETNRNFIQQAGQMAAGLRQGGFDTAMANANTDLSRALTAQQSNQSAGLQGMNLGLTAQQSNQQAGLQSGLQTQQLGTDVSQQNANNWLQAMLQSQQANLSGQQSNQDAYTAMMQQLFQGQQANQQAGLDAASLNMQGGMNLANLSEQQRQQYFGNAAMLEGAGSQQQQWEQAQLDDAYAKWLEANNYDMNMVGFLSNVSSGMPSMGGTSSSSSSPSAMSQIGSAVGTIGALMAFSDKNMKSGRKPVRDEDVLDAVDKTGVETWRYDPAKGGPDDGGVTHLGPMAQSVKKNLGIGNGHMLPVVDMMGAQFAATKALSKKVKKLEKRK